MSEIGHNSGISPAEVIGDEIDAILASFLRRRDELIAAEGRADIKNNDDVGKAGDLIGMMRVLAERVGGRREEAEEPYVLAVNSARARVDKWLTPLEVCRTNIGAKIQKFRDDQRQAILDQQQQQREAEAALRAEAQAKQPETPVQQAPLPAPEQSPIALPKVRGDMGSTTFERKVKVFTIPDPKKVDPKILNHPTVIEAMKKVCRDLAKVQPKIKGVIITEDARDQSRK